MKNSGNTKLWYRMLGGGKEMIVHCLSMGRAFDMWKNEHGDEPWSIEASTITPEFKSMKE